MADLFSDSIPTIPGDYWTKNKRTAEVRIHDFCLNESSEWFSNFLEYWSVGPKVLSPEETDRANWVMANLTNIQCGCIDRGRSDQLFYCVFGGLFRGVISHKSTLEAAIDGCRVIVEGLLVDSVDSIKSPEPQSPPTTQTDRESFLGHIKKASATVATWPVWKQNVLKNSDKPEVSTPRTPIVPDEEVKPEEAKKYEFDRKDCPHANLNEDMTECFDCGSVWVEYESEDESI